jgi:hypothetical protein
MKATSSDTALVVAAIAAAASLAVGVVGALAAYFSNKRERRRTLYSQATKAALAWKEMLYRVRRRQAGDEADLVKQFHALQDDLQYFQAWVGSESKFMARSYERLVTGTKRATEPLITQAWSDPVRPLPGNATKNDKHPDLAALSDAFLLDIRSQLSPLFWRKLAVAWRNRKKT